MSTHLSAHLRPFENLPWPNSIKPVVHTLWEWYDALWDISLNPTPEVLIEEAKRFEKQLPPILLSPSLAERIFALTQQFSWMKPLLLRQLNATPQLIPPTHFETFEALEAFIAELVQPQIYALAQLADTAHRWQRDMLNELAKAFFLSAHLLYLPEDLRHNRLFIPRETLQQFGVSVEQLKEGPPDESTQRMLWQWKVRAEVSLSLAYPLAHELPHRYARAFKHWWLGVLELLRVAESRNFNVWKEPITLSWLQQTQIRFQARFGRLASRNR